MTDNFTNTEQSLSSQDEEDFFEILNIITNKAIDNGLLNAEVPIVSVDMAAAQKSYSIVNFTKEGLEHLQTALKNPDKLQGYVKIWANDEQILHIEDGEVIKDSLNIVPHMMLKDLFEESIDTARREVEGKNLIEYITAVMETLGEYSPKSNWLYYDSKNYIFSQKDEQLKVTAKNDGREVLNNSGFTKAATDSDIAALQILKNIAQELILNHDSQTQRPSLKP